MAALAILAYPAVRPEALAGEPDRLAFDRAVFRDQLTELDRDVSRGLIGEREAEAARNEISRRLIAAVSGQSAAEQGAHSIAWTLATVLVVPIVAVPLYLAIGNPSLPDVPLVARLEKAVEQGDFAALIAKVEMHLAENPADVQGWKVIAPAYQRASRWADAANAYSNILKLSAPDAGTLADYGEMLVFANNGMVSADASRAFAQALNLDANLPKARYFHALALKQEGKTEEARRLFDRFLAESPADAPWRPMLEAELQDLDSRPPALGKEAIDVAKTMTQDDQQAMIRGMVEGLDQRLKTNGKDLEGWLRLMRARIVLNEPDRAAVAYESAKTWFRDDPKALAALDDLARELKIP